jgi:hypothetical protein
VIDGLLRDGESINTIAAPKVGKSWMVHDLAVSVALGLDWFGHATTQGSVLLIDLELHKQTLARRLAAVCKARGVVSDALARRLSVRVCRGKGLDIRRLAELIRQTVKPGEVRMIVLDALYRLIPEGLDENSNTDIRRVYDIVDEIADHTRAAVVIVHHATKGRQDDKRVTDTGAGGGSQSRAADAHLIMRPHATEGAVVVEAVARSFPAPKPFVIRQMNPGWALDTEGLDPADLWQPPKRKSRKDAAADDDKPKPEPWTAERFVAAFMGPEPTDEKIVKARAREAGIGVRDIDHFLTLAKADGLAHPWEYPKDRVRYVATEPQPATASIPKSDDAHTSHTRARTPRTPRETHKRPRGSGKRARESATPPPPTNSRFVCPVSPLHARGWRPKGAEGGWTCGACHPPAQGIETEWSEGGVHE